MLYITQDIIVPIIYSTIIAIALSPVVDILERKGMNRIIAISLTLASTIIIVILIIILLSKQIMQFTDSIPMMITKFEGLIDEGALWISETFNISPRKVNAFLLEQRTKMISGSGSNLGQTLMNTGSVLVALVLVPVYILMILYYRPLLLEFIHKLFMSTKHKEVNSVLTATKKIIQSYLVGLLLEAVIVATLNSVSMLIIGIEYAVVLGVIGAILNLIPYLGGILAAGLSMLVALATTSSFSTCLMVLISFIIIQLIDNNYIIPKVVASKVKINALASVVVVLVGGALWGIPGMFLSIPLTAIIKVIFDHIEPLKPWGYLLGDTMPPYLGIKIPFKKKVEIKKITP